LGPFGELFKIADRKIIAGLKPPPAPYLVMMKRGERELHRAYVGWGRDDQAIFGSVESGLTRDKTSIVTSLKPGILPGAITQSLWLRTPPNFSGPGTGSVIMEVKNSRANLAPFIQSLEQQVAKLTPPAATGEAGMNAAEVAVAQELRAEISTQNSPKPKNNREAAPPIAESASASELLALVFEIHWTVKAGTTPNPAEEFRKALRSPEPDWPAIREKLKGDFNYATGQLTGKSQFKGQKSWVEKIDKLSQSVCAIEGDKQRLRKNADAQKKAMAQAELAAKTFREHPLLQDKLPSGTYTLLVQAGEAKVPLIDFHIP
jgi:hypothetical protein